MNLPQGHQRSFSKPRTNTLESNPRPEVKGCASGTKALDLLVSPCSVVQAAAAAGAVAKSKVLSEVRRSVEMAEALDQPGDLYNPAVIWRRRALANCERKTGPVADLTRGVREANMLDRTKSVGCLELRGLANLSSNCSNASTSAGPSSLSTTACSSLATTPRGGSRPIAASEALGTSSQVPVKEMGFRYSSSLDELESAELAQGTWLETYEAHGLLPPPRAQNKMATPEIRQSRTVDCTATPRTEAVKELAQKFKQDFTDEYLRGHRRRHLTGPPEQQVCVIC